MKLIPALIICLLGYIGIIAVGTILGHAMFGEPPLPTQKVLRVDLSKAQQDEIIVEISTNLVEWVKVCTFHKQSIWVSSMEIEAETTNNCFLRQQVLK